VQHVVVAEVIRSGFVESEHHGSVVAVAPDGTVLWSVGNVTGPIFARSCNKPLQATGMVRSGLAARGELLALACASHSGEPYQLEGVRSILAGAGLTEAALQTPADWPLDELERISWQRSGRPRVQVAMNCSGKHAAMLATCVYNGWDVSAYRDPAHPLQQQLAATFAELTGEAIVATGVDGCGAPLFSTSLTGLARAFASIALAPADSAEGAVAAAIRSHPEHVSGTRRDEAALLRAYPGAIAKSGAEASYAVALPDGTAVALKIADGGARARPVVMAAALRRLGHGKPALDEIGSCPVLGGGVPVGEVRAVV